MGVLLAVLLVSVYTGVIFGRPTSIDPEETDLQEMKTKISKLERQYDTIEDAVTHNSHILEQQRKEMTKSYSAFNMKLNSFSVKLAQLTNLSEQRHKEMRKSLRFMYNTELNAFRTKLEQLASLSKQRQQEMNTSLQDMNSTFNTELYSFPINLDQLRNISEQRQNEMKTSIQDLNSTLSMDLTSIFAEIENLTTKVDLYTSQHDSGNCSRDWISSPTKLYYISQEYDVLVWFSAKELCENMDGSLVEIKTDEEAEFLLSKLPSRVSPTSFLYTGRIWTKAHGQWSLVGGHWTYVTSPSGQWTYVTNGDRMDPSVRSAAVGYTDDPGQLEYGCIRPSDRFRMLGCVETLYHGHFVCEKPVTGT